MLPNRWIVRKVDRRINQGNERAWWVAANPATNEGKLFAKHQHVAANDYAAKKNRAILNGDV